MNNHFLPLQMRGLITGRDLRKSRLVVTCIAVLSSSVMLLGCEAEPGCPKMNCGDFASQGAAQSAYNGDRDCYKNLDRDKDGIACENM